MSGCGSASGNKLSLPNYSKFNAFSSVQSRNFVAAKVNIVVIANLSGFGTYPCPFDFQDCIQNIPNFQLLSSVAMARLQSVSNCVFLGEFIPFDWIFQEAIDLDLLSLFIHVTKC